jgi:hypothetical protein
VKNTSPVDDLERCLEALLEAADGAEALGIDATPARQVHADAVGRLGFPAEAYVLALVGGTGVGKSSLLNALAGAPVSAASVRRPTTNAAVAWIPRAERTALEPLLEWLDVREVHEHGMESLRSVAILDLPDIDSITPEHRAQVDALLPRVDGVAWVTDPEKYHDAVLHDDFLRRWLPRLERQAIVVNKLDRLAPDDRTSIRRDLERDVERAVLAGRRPTIPVLLTSATGAETAEFASWLAEGVEAKAIVRGRLSATIADLAARLSAEAGVDGSRGYSPFVEPGARRAALEEATDEVLRAVDLRGLERQAIAATRARARAKGTGPAGIVTSLVYRLSGREMQAADPERYLVRWRDRATLAPALEAVRLRLAQAVRDASPAVRPQLAAALEPTTLRVELERAVDRSIARRERVEPPSSRWWPVVGFLQTLATAAIALSVAWVILWVLAHPPVDSVVVPVVGQIPMPFAALVVSLAVGYVLARVIGIHAGWFGRRWARDLRHEIEDAVKREIGEAFQPLDRLERARQSLWATSREIAARCPPRQSR